jgi:hypothetical protein
VIFLVAKFHHFAKKKSPKQHGQGTFWKFFKKSSHFKEKSFEITKIFEGLG